MPDLKELAKRSIELFNAHDAAGLAELDDPDVVFSSPSPSGRNEIRGRDAVREYNQGWFDAFPDARITVVTECIGEDSIATEAIFEGTHTGPMKSEMGEIPPTGKSLKGHYVQIVRVKDGLNISGSLYFDQVELMTQLGLMPAMAGASA
jgi:predicted ester cyclase